MIALGADPGRAMLEPRWAYFPAIKSPGTSLESMAGAKNLSCYPQIPGPITNKSYR
jgi:hypothetical protein